MRKVVAGVTVSLALFGAALIAPAAQAAPCDGVGMQQPFLAWHDSADYVLVDGGDFETAAAGWTLDGGAATVAGGNTLRAESTATALSLPSGSSATSPATCVTKGNPTARLFSQAVPSAPLAKPVVHGPKPDHAPKPGSGPKPRVQVEVLYLNSEGGVRKVKKAGKLRAGAEWAPTRKFSLAQGQFQTQSGGGESAKAGGSGSGKAQIALRFTALTGNVLIDDVFVDPRFRL